jgi:4-amino-4-deoxy-L-arabinose transferase-like glycosyltransferase
MGTFPRLIPPMLLFAVILIAGHYVFHTGFMSSDDSNYVYQARQLVEKDNWLPSNHFGFRYPLVVSLAVLESVHLVSETSLSLLSLFFTLLVGFAVVAWTGGTLGNRAAWIAALLAGSLPLLVLQSSVANPDIMEALFLLLSTALFWTATVTVDSRRALLLFLSGLALGLAMLTRETAYGFLLLYGLLFVLGAYIPRLWYLWGLAGVALVIGSEWIFYLVNGESAFFRYATAAETHGTVNLSASDFSAGSGNLSDNRFIGPPLALLFNQEFALLFWAMIVAWIYLYRRPDASAADRNLLKLLSAAFVVYFLWLSYSGAIRPLPRYYTYSAIIAVVMTSWALSLLRWRALFLLVLLSTNVLALSLDNIHSRFPSKTIIQYVQANPDVILATDPQTTNRASGMLELQRMRPGNLLGSDEELGPETVYALVGKRYQADKRLTAHQAEQIEERRYETLAIMEPPKLLAGQLLDLVRLDKYLSESLYYRIAYRNDPVIIARWVKGPE